MSSISPPPAQTGWVAAAPSLTMRAYFSSYHLWAAEHFAGLARDIENAPGEKPRFDIQHRAYVVNAIFSSVAFLESSINEVFQDVVDDYQNRISSLGLDNKSRKIISVFWTLIEKHDASVVNKKLKTTIRKIINKELIKKNNNKGKNTPSDILSKYQIFLIFCQKEQFDRGAQPYQSVKIIIDLRNALTHYKPKSYVISVQSSFDKKLQGKFPENPLMTGVNNPYFPDKCLGSGCAYWAFRATKELADKFFQKLNSH